MPKLSESFNAKIKAFRAQFRGEEIELFSYIDLLNYMLKYKIPQIVTLTHKIPQIVTLTRYNANTCAFLSIK